jgi:hypothetical protein
MMRMSPFLMSMPCGQCAKDTTAGSLPPSASFAYPFASKEKLEKLIFDN